MSDAANGKSWLTAGLEAHGVSRAEFLTFCASMAAMLGLPRAAAAQFPDAVASAEKPTVLWVAFQDCAGDTESFLRASHPTVAELVLDLISLDYHETLMAAAGFQAEAAREQTVATKRGEYIAIVEGSIPTGAGGAYCTIGGKSALQIAQEVCGGAAATVAIGTCASFGGLPAASPNPTSALSVADAVPGIKNLINLPACPANVENVTALLVHYMTTRRWPDLDYLRRPLFAYGTLIHENCQRRAHFDNGQYVENWGDEGHRLGYCLYKMGCKGPVTAQNCPIVRWNETNWPIGCGHPCVGCAEPNFWDANTPFYRHLEGVPGSGMGSRIDLVGLGVVTGVAGLFAAHGVAEAVRNKPADPGPDEKKG
ncbi:MAG: hydrogenase small subunit [Candidatus Baltobacteraceae bacterium]|jgi:hydrogenase small subunit